VRGGRTRPSKTIRVWKGAASIGSLGGHGERCGHARDRAEAVAVSSFGREYAVEQCGGLWAVGLGGNGVIE